VTEANTNGMGAHSKRPYRSMRHPPIPTRPGWHIRNRIDGEWPHD